MTDDSSSLYAIIISVASLGVAIFTFILNWFQTKAQRLSSESTFISDIQKEFSEESSGIDNLKTKKQCLMFTWQFLNTLDRVCFFETTGRLQDNIIEYFRNHLELGYRYYNWLIKVAYKEDSLLKSFPYVKQTCKKYSVKEDDRRLIFMEKYDSLPDDVTTSSLNNKKRSPI